MGHIYTVLLPDIGEGVVEGEVIEWLKNPGDSLAQDEAVVLVMTDKATVELPTPYPGKLHKIYVGRGEIAIKDKPLYAIEVAEGIEISKAAPSDAPQPVSGILAHFQQNEPSHSTLATPATRKLARQMGLDIHAIQGTGKDGRVTPEDLQRYSSRKVSSDQITEIDFNDDTIEPLIGIPKRMAERMLFSKQNIAHFSYFETVDVSRLIKMHEHFKQEGEKQEIHVTYMPFFLRALSLALTKFPKFNSSVDLPHQRLIIHKQQNIGIAMASEGGLIVPVLKNVQNMGLQDIVRAYEHIKQQAAAKQLSPSDMKGATISLSNFGVFGGNGVWATPIINPPEVAILAVSRIQEEPVVKHGTVVTHQALHLSWSFNHQVIDGEMASKFSHFYASLLENPAQLL